MKVILESDITGLGEEGSIVDVSPGYARNYLFPRKKAIQHNTKNISVLKSRMKSIEHRRNERRTMHAGIKERLESEILTIPMKSGEKGHLYGAVTAQMVSELLEKKGISIPKSHIVLPDGHSIKNTGVYPITIKLYHGVQAQCSITVTDQHGKNAQTSPDAPQSSDATNIVAAPEQESEQEKVDTAEEPTMVHSENTDAPQSADATNIVAAPEQEKVDTAEEPTMVHSENTDAPQSADATNIVAAPEQESEQEKVDTAEEPTMVHSENTDALQSADTTNIVAAPEQESEQEKVDTGEEPTMVHSENTDVVSTDDKNE